MASKRWTKPLYPFFCFSSGTRLFRFINVDSPCILVTSFSHTNLSLESCPYFVESCSGKSKFISISRENKKLSEWGQCSLSCWSWWAVRGGILTEVCLLRACDSQHSFLALARTADRILRWFLTAGVEVWIGSWQLGGLMIQEGSLMASWRKMFPVGNKYLLFRLRISPNRIAGEYCASAFWEVMTTGIETTRFTFSSLLLEVSLLYLTQR